MVYQIAKSVQNTRVSVDFLIDAAGVVVEKRKNPGFDGMTIEELLHTFDPAQVLEALESRHYRFSPRLAGSLIQPSGKRRRILRTTLRDAVVDRGILNYLQPVLDPILLPSCIGGRPGGQVRHALQVIEKSRADGFHFATRLDVKNFFDDIDRDLLFGRLRELGVDALSMFVIEGLTTSPVVKSRNRVSIPERGIGQGASICPLIANVFAHDIDTYLESIDVRHIRWLDDILVLTATKKEAINARTLATELTEENLDLTMHEKDTTGPIWEQSFLGFEPVEDGGFRIAERSFERLLTRVEHWLRRKRKEPSEAVKRITQSLRGWIDFYQIANVHDVDKLWKVEKEINQRIRGFLRARGFLPKDFEEIDLHTGLITPSLTRSLGWRSVSFSTPTRE